MFRCVRARASNQHRYRYRHMCSETRQHAWLVWRRARGKPRQERRSVHASCNMLTSQKHPERSHAATTWSAPLLRSQGHFLLRRRERGTPDMAKRLARSSFLARKQSNGYTSTAGGKVHKSSENSKLIFSPQIRRLRASGGEAAA